MEQSEGTLLNREQAAKELLGNPDLRRFVMAAIFAHYNLIENDSIYAAKLRSPLDAGQALDILDDLSRVMPEVASWSKIYDSGGISSRGNAKEGTVILNSSDKPGANALMLHCKLFDSSITFDDVLAVAFKSTSKVDFRKQEKAVLEANKRFIQISISMITRTEHGNISCGISLTFDGLGKILDTRGTTYQGNTIYFTLDDLDIFNPESQFDLKGKISLENEAWKELAKQAMSVVQ